MSRGTLAGIVLSLAVTAAGCRMCASPYDDCRPTFTGQCGEDCAPLARAGSVLSGYFPPMYPDQFPADQVPDLPDLPDDQLLPPGVALSAADGQPALDAEPATDAELATDAQPATDGQIVEPPPEETVAADAARPSGSQGWTAVRRASTRSE